MDVRQKSPAPVADIAVRAAISQKDVILNTLLTIGAIPSKLYGSAVSVVAKNEKDPVGWLVNSWTAN